MDATQKRKMQTVTRIHFWLTFLCMLSPLFISPGYRWYGANGGAYFQTYAHFQTRVACLEFFRSLGIILQPQFLLFRKLFEEQWTLFVCLTLVSIPIWSICFGWLFVKLDNWLNHFPVLGKRVF